jgi:radical SAM superfamily enzyme YgiQ (UPF0313 family)
MALLTLGGVLKELGVKSELWDFELYFKNARNASEETFRKLLRAGLDGVRANVFGISSICSNLPMALWIAKEIKAYKPKSIVVLGGAQPSSIPEMLIERFECVDLVVVGEGEKTLEDLVRADFDPSRYAGIPGLAYRQDGRCARTAPRLLVENMDELPFPDYSLVDYKDYEPHQISVYKAHVEVGRGCPYVCTFCSTAIMWEKNFRVKSPKRILDEMTALHDHFGFTEFQFIHDNFTTSKRYVDQFCDYMEKENRNGLKWYTSSRTDCLTLERLERMHDTGLIALFFGLETGSARMQKIIRKGLQLDKFEPILKRLNELDMGAATSFIIGFPEETKEDIDETIWRALHYKSLGTSHVFFSPLTPLTGTSIYRDTLGKLKDLSPSASSCMSPQHSNLPWVKEIILKHPDMFSSFYHVPHPTLSLDYLTRLVEFAYLLVYGASKLSLMIIENLGISATHLFEMWDEWANEREISYYLFKEYSSRRFRVDFQSFVDQKIFPSKSLETRREDSIFDLAAAS